MPASLKTKARAAQFDSLRSTTGITGNLTLYSVSATGYPLIATLSAGWYAQHETNQIDGTQCLAVRVAETDANLGIMTATVVKTIAAIGINSLRHKVNSKVDPLEDPRLWLLRCEPTGESSP